MMPTAHLEDGDALHSWKQSLYNLPQLALKVFSLVESGSKQNP